MTLASLTNVTYASGLLEELDDIINNITLVVETHRLSDQLSVSVDRLKDLYTLLDSTQGDMLANNGQALSRRYPSKVEQKGLSQMVVNLWKQNYTMKSIAKTTGLSVPVIKSFLTMYQRADSRTKLKVQKTSILDTYAVMQDMYERIISTIDRLEGASVQSDDVSSKYMETLRKLINDASTWEAKRADNMRVENVMKLIVEILRKKDQQFATEVISEFKRHYAINEQMFTPSLLEISAE